MFLGFSSANMDATMDGATIPRSPSSSVGDYLKAVWELAEGEAASTKDVADRLSVNPASVTNMFARLRGMGLVEYERYRGASLTEEGLSEALRRELLPFGIDVVGGAREILPHRHQRCEGSRCQDQRNEIAQRFRHPTTLLDQGVQMSSAHQRAKR